MSIHSDIIGSFLRRSNLPLEADYIFNSESDLKEFYQKEENNPILHEGLLKVVITDEEQSLYWVVKEEDKLIFKKLINSSADEDLIKVIEELEKEIKDRIEADNELRGTESIDDLEDGMQNLLHIGEQIKSLKKRVEIEEEATANFKKELQEIVGSETEEYMQVLRSLDFKSIKEISEKLKEVDDYLKDKIDDGEDTLLEELKQLVESIMGDPLPSKPFRTLRGIEDIFTKRKILIDNKIKELQGEVDNIELGVGLEASGAYRPDQDTKYLKGTVSVMHALKVLDSMIDEAITHTNLTPVITKTVNLQVKNLKDSTEISADVLLDQEGEIIERDGGLYYKVRFESKDGNLEQYVNGVKVDTISLGLSSMLDDVHYDADTEHIIIKFKLNNGQNQEIKLPVHDLIEEWEVKNDNPSDVVTLSKVRNIKGKDQLSGDVRIADVKGNQLEKKGNALYVAPQAFGEKELQDILDRLTYLTGQLQKLEAALENFKEEVGEKFEEVAKEIERIEKIIEQLREDFEEFKVWVQNEVKRIDEKIDKAVSDLNNRIDEEVKSLNDRIDEEVKQLNETISNKVKELNDRITKEVETLNNTIKELDSKLTKLIENTKKELQSNIDALDKKLTDAITEVKNDLSKLREEFDNLKKDVDALKEDFEKRIKALEVLTEKHTKELEKHTKEIAENKAAIEKLQTIIDESCYWWENEKPKTYYLNPMFDVYDDGGVLKADSEIIDVDSNLEVTDYEFRKFDDYYFDIYYTLEFDKVYKIIHNGQYSYEDIEGMFILDEDEHLVETEGIEFNSKDLTFKNTNTEYTNVDIEIIKKQEAM